MWTLLIQDRLEYNIKNIFIWLCLAKKYFVSGFISKNPNVVNIKMMIKGKRAWHSSSLASKWDRRGKEVG